MSNEVTERTEELAALMNRASGSANSHSTIANTATSDTGARTSSKFDLLHSGDWELAGYKSQSEADLALCRTFSRLTEDPQRIDSLFRSSELTRPKWDEKHSTEGKTYGDMRIPVKPATQSGESGHPVGAKRRWGFHDVSGGRFESM